MAKKNTFSAGAEAHIISAVAAGTRETGAHIDNARDATIAAVAAGTRETGQHIEAKGNSIIAAISGRKTVGFIVLSVILAVILGCLLFWVTGLQMFQVPAYDMNGTFIQYARDAWSWFVVVLVPLAFLVWMIYVTNWGLAKKGEEEDD